jgi:Zn finger protein HypA/HybF involved in hydrogenase expression
VMEQKVSTTAKALQAAFGVMPRSRIALETVRPMIAYKDGRFVCRDCAHTVRPGVPEYKCTCRPCLRQGQGEPN